MFYPIKRLLSVQPGEKKVSMALKWKVAAVMVIKHQQRAAGLIQVPDSQLETYIPEKDECYLLCCWDYRWDAEECVYLIQKNNLG